MDSVLHARNIGTLESVGRICSRDGIGIGEADGHIEQSATRSSFWKWQKINRKYFGKIRMDGNTGSRQERLVATLSSRRDGHDAEDGRE
jgi:hypothetical protein